MTYFEQISSKGAFFMLPERLLIRVTGSDRLRYLNGQVTNDLKRLVPREAMQACLLTPKGKLSAVIWMTLQEEAILLEAPLELSEELMARLERYLVADDVVLEVIPSEPTIHVFGDLLDNPVLKKISGVLIPRLAFPGKDIKISQLPSDFLKKHQTLTEDQVEVLRIAQGVPKWGAELTPDRLPPEAHLERQAIDYNKGCYVGQEVISRLRSVGRVNRLLVGFSTTKEGEVLHAGMKLFSLSDSEKSIGFITSAVQAFGADPFMALGYLARNFEGHDIIAIDETTGRKVRIIKNL
ncbi:MAG: hypothetical protein K2W97_03640 [Chthoniobacterales bacterium]|nr:hypothetical protein [Chthoniobacterales bacterium]